MGGRTRIIQIRVLSYKIEAGYSARRASIGLTDAARRAGR